MAEGTSLLRTRTRKGTVGSNPTLSVKALSKESAFLFLIIYLFWYNLIMEKQCKPLVWIGSSLKDLKSCPQSVQGAVGHALYLAQVGEKSDRAKPLKGFGGAGVLEVMEDHSGNAYRAIYTVHFREVIYVLHVFQKKSKKGISTPQQEIELIKERLKRAELDYKTRKDGAV